MRIPTPEQWKAFGEVMVTWGFGFIVYGIITICIGLIIIGLCILCSKQSVKYLR
ncbi:hypothetical protein [Clostridium sp.]|uniref:hypothetical protein n=1 Tax=Clostridium sp. TaxID=1506 RepID=UPI00283FC202|nr:hypothetical protein [Clostridium sp.]MDR3595071.1 hypothetical protein [Clostridium sp.]